MSRRLVVVHPSDELYGADKVLLEVLSSLPPGIDPEVWLPTDIEYPLRELSTALAARGIPVMHLPMPVLRRAYLRPVALPGLVWRFLVALKHMLRARPDLLYVSTSAVAPYVLLGRLVGARTVVHLHEYLDGVTRSIVAPMLRPAQRVIAVSSSVREVLPARIADRAVVVHNAFDLPGPQPVPTDAPHRVLLASRWNAWKGHEVLLEAWGRISRRDLQLVVLGAPPPSGARVDVPAIVAALPNADTVVVAGQTGAVVDELASCVAVVVPSIRPDPLPTIAIEALAAGRYLIASDCGGLPEILGDAPGQLVRPGDVQAWADALEALDLEECLAATGRARARFDAAFSLERFRGELYDVLVAAWGSEPGGSTGRSGDSSPG